MESYNLDNVGPGEWEGGTTRFRHPVNDNGQFVGLIMVTLDANRPQDFDRRQWVADRLNMMVAEHGAEAVRETIADCKLQL